MRNQELHQHHGLGIYHPGPGTGGTSEAHADVLRSTVSAMQRLDPSRHLYMETAHSCGNDQLDRLTFDKSIAANCIATRTEGAAPRSVIVLLGPEDENNYYIYIPTGMLVKFHVIFQRLQHGRETEDMMTVIVQL